jgi:lipoprotein-anchoring transpeptidase ErfK/SrfK
MCFTVKGYLANGIKRALTCRAKTVRKIGGKKMSVFQKAKELALEIKQSQEYQEVRRTGQDVQNNEAVWQALLASEEGDSLCAADEQGEKGRMLIVIDVAHRTLVLYEDDKEVCRYPVAVGKAKTPTPLGEWKVIHKGMGWGNGFGTRWMGLNVPWGIYGIHGTNKPGSIGTYASHGCIRMFNRDVEKLYPLVPWGCRVKIVNDGKMVPEQIKPVELKKKSSGQRVVYVQSRLKELGVEFDGADGRFGNMTELAVKYFQVWHGLEPSGIVDEATYRALGLIE